MNDNKNMKKIFLLLNLILISNLVLGAKDTKERLLDQGVWYLYSVRTEQKNDSENLAKVDYKKQKAVESVFFDKGNTLYTVDGSDVLEDRWVMTGNNIFTISTLKGESPQEIEVLEITYTKLVLRYCTENGQGDETCVISTYFSQKEGWPTDSEIDEKNSTGVIEIASFTP